MWTLDLPVTIKATAKKSLSLNMNAYRNWHYRDQHLTKELFEQIARAKLMGIPKLDKVHLHYVLWGPNKQRRDLMNVIAVVDKYFSDALVEAKVLDDDHSEIIISTSAAFGGIDRSNPRVTVTIVPVESPMELNLR